MAIVTESLIVVSDSLSYALAKDQKAFFKICALVVNWDVQEHLVT